MAYVEQRAVLKGMPEHFEQALERCGREGLSVFRAGDEPAAIVFVHGLKGHKFKTWGAFTRLGASADALGRCELGFFGYPTEMFSPRLLFPWLRPYDLNAKATALADELIDSQAQLGWRSVILAAHSLGGLVVLGALRVLVDRGTDADRRLLVAIRELAFYGTPFLGSDRVSAITALLSSDMRALFRGDDYRSQLIDWTHDRQLGDLLRLETTYARVNVLYSKRDSWVQEESARARFRGENQFDTTHTGLCKPDRADARPYLFLLAIAERVIANAPSMTSPQPRPTTAQRIRASNDARLAMVRAIYEDRLPAQERVPFDRFRQSLDEAAAAQEDATLNLRYLLVDGRGGKVAGFASALYVKGHRYAWFAYLAVAKQQGIDLGRNLAQQLAAEVQRRHGSCRGFVIEVEDPYALPAEGEDAQTYRRRSQARIRLYRKMGPVYRVAINYCQPRLEPDAGPDELPMCLLFAPTPPTMQLRYLTRGEVIEMLELIRAVQANAFRNDANAAAYAGYLEMWLRRQVDGLQQECITLSLEQERPAASESAMPPPSPAMERPKNASI